MFLALCVTGHFPGQHARYVAIFVWYRPQLSHMNCSISLISPYTAFSKPLPPSPQVSKQIIIQPDIERVLPQGTNFLVLDGLPSGAPHSPIHSAQWRECSHDTKCLQRTLDRFSRTLRPVHKRKINWPKNESFPNK